VVNYGDKTLSILDLRTRTEIATLPVGLHPQELAVDSKSNRIYVANVQGNSVTGSHPHAVAVDQSSGHAYAANYGAPWVTPLPDAPQSIPQSPIR
jgi:YVTN family beta-propeller protein